MKLKAEKDFIKKRFADNAEKIKEYAPRLKESGQYQNFEVRLVWDCIHAFIGSNTVCEWYDKYECNDSHVFTVGKAALKELNII